MNLLKAFKMAMFFVSMLSVTVLLSGCANTQKSDFYQLNEQVGSSLIGVEKGSVIGVGPIQLPEYLNRPQIVIRDSDHHLNVSEFHRWVEPLNDNIIRVLVINLSNQLQSNRVYWIPRQERQYPLNYRVAIDIGRFDGQFNGMVSLETRWSIFDKNDQPVLTRVSLIQEPVNGLSHEHIVIAMNQALKTLGAEISEALKTFLKNN